MKAFLRFSRRSKRKAKKMMADETATTSAGATTSIFSSGSSAEAITSISSTSSAGAITTKRHSSRDFEVFLNFRGPDCRFTVVNVLYDALDRAGIRVFYDDESIRPGEVIEGELKEAIINSKIYIPIFSKNYASSRWCLRELDFILECYRASQKQAEKKTILPIFYDVDVSTDLKLESQLYTTALRRHRDNLGENVVERWENALRTAATIKGWDIHNHGLTDLTKLIVEEVCCMLWTRSDPEKVLNDYVGIDYPMEDIMKLLNLDVQDVRFVTIHGMGGVGKTTLAKLVFNKISSVFGQKAAFLSDIRDKSRTDTGILNLQKELISQLLQEMRLYDALKLFSRQVFESDSPPKECDKISREVVETTGGLPLAIGVIAPLFKNNNIDGWEGTLEKLKNLVHKDVREKLMVSYERLDKCEKEIFLDVACLFINKEIEDATYYWEARQLYSKTGIMVLRNMSLIEIVDGHRLRMHDLLRDLGRNLVDEETDIHGKRSRLWSPEVALNVVRRKKGTEEVEAIRLENLNADCNFNYEEFAGLEELKFLELNGGNFTNQDFKKVFSELKWLSWYDCPPEFQATNLCFKNLVVLMLLENLITDDWGGWCEIKEAKHLRVLKCTYCRFLVKSPDFSAFPALERLIFKNCAALSEIDLSIGKLKHLTYLEITNPLIYVERLPDEYISYQLEEGGPLILPDSIGNLHSLLVLKLKFVNLLELPDSIGELLNLKYLCLLCPKLKELPEWVGDLYRLVELDISFTGITHIPRSVDFLKFLKVFKYENCQLGEDANMIERLISLNRHNLNTVEELILRSLNNPTGTERIRSLQNRSLYNPIGTERIESLKNK